MLTLEQMARGASSRSRKHKYLNRFANFIDGCHRYGWVVVGQERLSMSLMLGAFLGDILALRSLVDLYLENDMGDRADRPIGQLAIFAENARNWTAHDYRAFVAKAREYDIYR